MISNFNFRHENKTLYCTAAMLYVLLQCPLRSFIFYESFYIILFTTHRYIKCIDFFRVMLKAKNENKNLWNKMSTHNIIQNATNYLQFSIFHKQNKTISFKNIMQTVQCFHTLTNAARKSSGMKRTNKLGVSVTNCCQVIQWHNNNIFVFNLFSTSLY